MKKSTRTTILGACAGLAMFATAPTALAHGGYGGDSYSSQSGTASSYINGDSGVNADVDPNSSCFSPDQFDTQAFSAAGSTANNVHNDACFLDRSGRKIDGPASFQSSGVGVIFACPDPDGAGPKVAVLSDANRDGRNDLCFQSGYQEKNAAGDLEFHARVNNQGTAGTQYVTWCSDSDRNGCDDEWNKSSIRVDWSADGTVTYRNDDRRGGDDRDGSRTDYRR